MSLQSLDQTMVKRRRLIVAIATPLVSVLLIGASFGVGYAVAGQSIADLERAIAVEEATPEVDDARAQPVTALDAVTVRTCSIDELAQNEALGTFAGVVVNPLTGESLFERNADTDVTPASVQKIVTAAAALTTLGPDTRFETTVVQSSNPESLVLVAGGDATLSALPVGSESVYEGAPKLATLAEQTIASLQEGLPEGERLRITELVVDVSLWDSEDTWEESWKSDARSNGFISLVTPLQVDGDRQNPTSTVSRRSNDAIDKAARAFVDALRQAGNTARFVTITRGEAEPGARVLGAVQSQPVSQLVTYMLKESDNTLAEMLARHVSIARGLGGSSDTLQEALVTTLAATGMAPEQVTVRDGSGLSAENTVQPRYITGLLSEIHRSPPPLGSVREGLAIAGADGSLDDRFTAANAIAQGKVLAKTGSIEGVRSLAGFVTAEDGTDLAFSFFATGDVDDSARDAIDAVVTGVYTCGNNLADF